MPRQRSPNRDKAFEIYKQHNGNIELVTIAENLNLSSGTIRGWKNKDKWDDKLNGTFRKKNKKVSERSEKKKPNKILFNKKIKEDTDTSLIVNELNERQRLFAEIFVRTPIAYKAAIKAGYAPDRAYITGSELVRNSKVKAYIDYLKELKRESIMFNVDDLVDLNMRIAFGDIKDYAEFGRERVPVMVKGTPIFKKNEITGEMEPVTKLVNSMKLKEDYEVDGEIIAELKCNNQGIRIKLHDKMKAIQWLTDYFEWNPDSKYKKEFDNRKINIEEEKLEILKEKNEIDSKRLGADDNNSNNLEQLSKAIRESAKEFGGAE